MLAANNFDNVHAYADSGGYDEAYIYDSAANDTLVATPVYNKLFYGDRSNHFVRAKYFDAAYSYSTTGGYDAAHLSGSGGADTLNNTPSYTRLLGSGFYNRAKYFEEVYATGSASSNVSIQTAPGDNYLEASGSQLYFTNASVKLWLDDFGTVVAKSVAGSTKRKHVGAIDFVLVTQGYWIDV